MGSPPTASAEFVRTLRKRLDFDQDQLARALDCGVRSVRRWEKHGADTRTLYALCWLGLQKLGSHRLYDLLNRQDELFPVQ